MLQYVVLLGTTLTTLVQLVPTSGPGILLYNLAPVFFEFVIGSDREGAATESSGEQVEEA